LFWDVMHVDEAPCGELTTHGQM